MVVPDDKYDDAVKHLTDLGYVHDDRHVSADPRIHSAYLHAELASIVIFRKQENGGYSVEGAASVIQHLLDK